MIRRIIELAGYYAQGSNGMPQDWAKANELWLKAGELGYAEGYYNLGVNYEMAMARKQTKKNQNTTMNLQLRKGMFMQGIIQVCWKERRDIINERTNIS